MGNLKLSNQNSINFLFQNSRQNCSIELPPSTLLTANPGGDGGAEDGADGYSGGGADTASSDGGGNGGSDGGDGEDSSYYYGGSGSGLEISTIPLKNVVIR